MMTSQPYFSFPPARAAMVPAFAFHPSQAQLKPPVSAVSASSPAFQQLQDQAIINQALDLMGDIQFLPQDVATIQDMGIKPLFRNGKEALDLIRQRGIKVGFGNMGNSSAHAQWVNDANFIMINQRYRNNPSPAIVSAISEALLHEAAHAKDAPDLEEGATSSIVEETDCLALNAMAHHFHEMSNPELARNAPASPLLANGVNLYSDFFFKDPDPNRPALVNRIVEKYGSLPAASPIHPLPQMQNGKVSLVARVMAQLNENQIKYWNANQPVGPSRPVLNGSVAAVLQTPQPSQTTAPAPVSPSPPPPPVANPPEESADILPAGTHEAGSQLFFNA